MVQRNEEEGKEKGEVLDASLLISGMHGLTTIFSVVEFPPADKYCKILFPDREDFKIALDIAWKLRESGKTIGATDILNASICINRDLTLVASDRDYENITLIEPKFRLKLVG